MSILEKSIHLKSIFDIVKQMHTKETLETKVVNQSLADSKLHK